MLLFVLKQSFGSESWVCATTDEFETLPGVKWGCWLKPDNSATTAGSERFTGPCATTDEFERDVTCESATAKASITNKATVFPFWDMSVFNILLISNHIITYLTISKIPIIPKSP